MKVSEYIKKLEELKKKYGDLPCYKEDDFFGDIEKELVVLPEISRSKKEILIRYD